MNTSPINKDTMMKIYKYGTYYNPATKHYKDSVNITCDKCSRSNLNVAIGLESYDMCLECINEISNMQREFTTSGIQTQMMQNKFSVRTNMEQNQFDVRTNMMQNQFNPSNIQTYMQQNKFNTSELRTMMSQNQFDSSELRTKMMQNQYDYSNIQTEMMKNQFIK